MDLQTFADVAGVLSKGTKLEFKGTGTDYTELVGLKSVPELGSEPEQVDVTHLGSAKKVNIQGLQDPGTLEFPFVFKEGNFDVARALDDGKEHDFKITFPTVGNITYTFKGQVSIKFDSTEVNNALGFTLSVTVSEGPDLVATP